MSINAFSMHAQISVTVMINTFVKSVLRTMISNYSEYAQHNEYIRCVILFISSAGKNHF